MRKELLLIPLILLTACASDVFVISAYNNTYENLTVIGVSGGVAYFNSSNGIVSITDFLFNETTKELYVNGSLVCTVANGVCNASGTDLNNYTTGISFTRSGNTVTLDLSRVGMSNLSASFTDNTSGSTNTFGYGLNVSGGLVTVANLTACNPVTEYSVWDGTEWQCDNDGGGTDTNNYTTNISFVGRILNLARDGMVNLTASLIDDSILLNWLNITGRPTDLANFTNTPGYITSAPNINVTNFKEANSTTAQLNLSDGRVLNATLNFGTGTGNGNITGSGTVAGEGVYAYNATDLRTNKILYVEPNNGSDIQAKINQCGNTGCKVVIPTGTYNLQTELTIYNYTFLQGAGVGATILNISGNYSVITSFTPSQYISITDMQIYCNSTSNINSTGIYLIEPSNVYMNNLLIKSCYYGIYIDGENNVSGVGRATNIVSENNFVGISVVKNFNNMMWDNIYLKSNLNDGLRLSYVSHHAFYNLQSKQNANSGIIMDNSHENYFQILLQQNSIHGFVITNSRRNIIIGESTSNGYAGLYFQTSVNDSIVSSFIANDNGQTDNTRQGIYVSSNSNRNIFSNNQASNSITNSAQTQRRGFEEATGAQNNTFISNIAFDNRVNNFLLNGNNSYRLGNSYINNVFPNFIGINNSGPTSALDVSGNASFSGNVATYAGLFSNGSQVCTAANGLCTGASGGNASSVNGTAGLPAVWSSATNLVAQLISNFMIGNKAVNSSQLNTSNSGSSGQYLMLNSTGGLDWNTVTSSGGSGNITGNLTSGNIPYAANSTHLENSWLSHNSTATIVNSNFIVNDVSRDVLNMNYFPTYTTEFCSGNTVNNANYDGFNTVLISSGLFAAITTVNQSHPCIIGTGDSTTAGGGVMIRNSEYIINGTENATMIWKQVNGQDQYIKTKFGFFDAITLANEDRDGCMFMMQTGNHSGQSNQLKGVCYNNNVNYNTTNNYTYTNGTWYILNMYVNAANNNVTFKVYNETGSLLWNNSVGAAGIPSTRETGFGFFSAQNNSDAAVTYNHLDYMSFSLKKTIRKVVFNG